MPASAQKFFRARYRVLVVKNEQASEPHQRVIAISIDQNLTGRGRDLDEALDELMKSLMSSLVLEWSELVPAYVSDPDPEVEETFKSKATHTADGDLVLRRLTADLLLVFSRKASPTSRSRPKVTYEECMA